MKKFTLDFMVFCCAVGQIWPWHEDSIQIKGIPPPRAVKSFIFAPTFFSQTAPSVRMEYGHPPFVSVG